MDFLNIVNIVFPTGVGMNRSERKRRPGLRRVPHRRGDEPFRADSIALFGMCSPQAWG